MTGRGTLEAVATELASAFLPLFEALDSPASLRELLAELGWEVPASVSSIGLDPAHVDDVVRTLGDVLELRSGTPDDATIATTYASLVAAVAILAQDVYELRNSIAGRVDAAILAASGMAQDLPKRLIDYLLVEYVRERYEPLYQAAITLGLFELQDYDRDAATFRSEHTRRVTRYDRMRKLLSDPRGLFGDVYGWGMAGADLALLVDRLYELCLSIGVRADLQFPLIEKELSLSAPAPVTQDGESTQPELRLLLFATATGVTAVEVGVTLYPIPPTAVGGAPGLALAPYASGTGEIQFPLDQFGTWILKVASDVDLRGGVGIVARPGEALRIIADLSGSGTQVSGSVQAELRQQPLPDDEMIMLLGAAGGSGLSARAMYLKAGLNMDTTERGDLFLELGVDDGKLRVSPEGADSFLSTILPSDALEVGFDFGIGWSTERGVYLTGATSLERVLGVHKTVGPLTLESVYLSIRPEGEAIPVVLAVTGCVRLGPLVVSADRLGFEMRVAFPDSGGNLGPADIRARFKPPDGAGLTIDASAIVGGGYLFFDAAKEEYAGVLQLEFQETITLTGIGLLTARLPDGSKGFSLLVIISAEDFTPIQLGYGFTLNGIGGLLGVNRTVVVDVLRAGIKNRTLDSVLFPEDPVRNAPQIISNLRAVFPPAENRYVFGPMAIIGWGTPTLVTIELGIVLEFPAPVRLVILGQVRAFLPDSQLPQITLQMDALGVIDFDKGDASVDATLYDSRLIQYVLTGDMALRANWGASPTFVLAVGGLHPRFQPPPAFPKLARVAVSLATGDNPRLRLETYLALTSNTAQIGARLELYAKEGGFNIEGWVGFDALFQFQPFQFVADVGGRVVVRRGGNKITSVGLDMTLTGPKPWHAWGKATFEILSIKHSVRFDVRFGQEEELPLPVAVDVRKLVLEAARDVRNWSGQLPKNGHPLVSLRPSGDSTSVLVHPQSELVFRQRVVPLNLTISKFGTTTPTGNQSFALREVKLNGREVKPTPVTEYFAPAQFFEMSDDEKLSRPSFEPLEAGIRFRTDTTHCKDPKRTPIEYETIIVDPKKAGPGERAENYPLPAKHLPALALLGAAGRAAFRRTGRAKYRAAGPRIAVSDGVYVVATTDKLKKEPIPGLDEGEAFSYTKAAEALRNFMAAHPEQRGSLQIVRDMRGRQDA